MKRTLYPKLLAGYLMYGVIGFLIITTFTYHITFAFVEKKGGCQPLPGIRPDLLQLCRELFFQDHDAGRDTDTAFHLKHLSLQRNLDRGHARQHHSEHGGAGL